MGKHIDISSCGCFNRSVHLVLTCCPLLTGFRQFFICSGYNCVVPFVTCILVLNLKHFTIENFNIFKQELSHCIHYSALTVVSIYHFVFLSSSLSYFPGACKHHVIFPINPLGYMTKGILEEKPLCYYHI